MNKAKAMSFSGPSMVTPNCPMASAAKSVPQVPPICTGPMRKRPMR